MIKNAQIVENWEKMAQAYVDFVEDENSFSNCIEMRCVKELLPSLQGQTALDLGCGNGRFTFELEASGAKEILGIDVSETMIAYSNLEKIKRQSKANFKCRDLSDLKSFEEASFDFIFSSTVFHFIEDLQPLYENIYRILKPGGVLMTSVIHPVYSAKYPLANKEETFPIEEDWKFKYLDKSLRAYVQPWIKYNPSIEDYLCKSYHHTLEDYFTAAVDSGFVFGFLREPKAPSDWAIERPNQYHAYQNMPVYLVTSWRKEGTGV